MFIGALNLKWESWIPVIILGAGAASLVVLVGKYWNYITRAMFCTMMICFSLVIYGIQSLDFNSVIVPPWSTVFTFARQVEAPSPPCPPTPQLAL